MKVDGRTKVVSSAQLTTRVASNHEHMREGTEEYNGDVLVPPTQDEFVECLLLCANDSDSEYFQPSTDRASSQTQEEFFRAEPLRFT